jgi:xylulokinase
LASAAGQPGRPSARGAVRRDAVCGVDIGTTHIKAVLVAEDDGSVVNVAKALTPVASDGHGPCHDPEEIRVTAEQVIREAQRDAAAATRITAVGVTSVGEEGVPLSSAGELLYPSIAWHERRPSQGERRWSARHTDDELFAVTGLHKDLGFTVFKWLWLATAQPDAWSRCHWWLGIADYVIWRWTGERGMSVSHASRTGVFELAQFRWKQDWVSEVLPRGADALPPLHEGGGTVGFLRPDAVPGLATADEVPVVVTGLDHTVGAYGAGVVSPGQVLDSMGTAEALIAPVPPQYLDRADESLGIDFSAGILPGTHIGIAGLESGAGVSGMLQALGASSPAQQRQLDARAAGLAPGAGGLQYIPPRMRDSAPGALLGHKVTHDAAHLYRAVVEGWAMAAGDALCGFGDPEGQREVTCIGGGTGSSLWITVKASLLGREIRCVRTPEIVAVGAALLAARARPVSRAIASWEPELTVTSPVTDWTPAYQALSQEFARAASVIHPGAAAHVYP